MSGGESDGHLEYDREERLVRELTDILGQNKVGCLYCRLLCCLSKEAYLSLGLLPG